MCEFLFVSSGFLIGYNYYERTMPATYISALLFCYFLSPFLLGGNKNIKNSLIIFSFVAFFRVGNEEIIRKGALNFMGFNFHHSPIIRLMEFYLGMLIIPLFLKIKSFLDKSRGKLYLIYIFTTIQIIFPITIYFVMLEFNNKLIRCYFVLIFCLCIFLISFDYGYLSNIIRNKIFKEIMSCQMEMYLLQYTLNNILIFLKMLN